MSVHTPTRMRPAQTLVTDADQGISVVCGVKLTYPIPPRDHARDMKWKIHLTPRRAPVSHPVAIFWGAWTSAYVTMMCLPLTLWVASRSSTHDRSPSHHVAPPKKLQDHLA